MEMVKELNQELDYDWLQEPSRDTTLYSGGDGIDSLSLVWLVVEVETRVNDELGASVSLANEKAMSMKRSPYRSVGAFVDFIDDQIRESS